MYDVLNLPQGDILAAWPKVTDFRCFVDFMSAQKKAEQEDRVPIRETIIYIVLLYTKDSFLNKKPVEHLQNRILKAAKLAGLDSDDEKIQRAVFDLDHEDVLTTVVDYLIEQNDAEWSDRCAIAAQMRENLRIRFKPIEKEKAEKEILNKHLLTTHYNDYKNNIKKLDAEIFLGHDKVKNEAVRKRSTLEALVK